MLVQKPTFTLLALGLLCGMSAGCMENRRTAENRDVRSDPANTTATKSTTDPTVRTTADPSNTGVNVRDRNPDAKTPFDQNENSADIKITADIRSRVVATKMSSNAHNVKIMTQAGTVTLRGPVTTAEEKQNIENIAKDVAGVVKVDSQLEVTN